MWAVGDTAVGAGVGTTVGRPVTVSYRYSYVRCACEAVYYCRTAFSRRVDEFSALLDWYTWYASQTRVQTDTHLVRKPLPLHDTSRRTEGAHSRRMRTKRISHGSPQLCTRVAPEVYRSVPEVCRNGGGTEVCRSGTSSIHIGTFRAHWTNEVCQGERYRLALNIRNASVVWYSPWHLRSVGKVLEVNRFYASRRSVGEVPPWFDPWGRPPRRGFRGPCLASERGTLPGERANEVCQKCAEVFPGGTFRHTSVPRTFRHVSTRFGWYPRHRVGDELCHEEFNVDLCDSDGDGRGGALLQEESSSRATS